MHVALDLLFRHGSGSKPGSQRCMTTQAIFGSEATGNDTMLVYSLTCSDITLHPVSLANIIPAHCQLGCTLQLACTVTSTEQRSTAADLTGPSVRPSLATYKSCQQRLPSRGAYSESRSHQPARSLRFLAALGITARCLLFELCQVPSQRSQGHIARKGSRVEFSTA